MNSEPSIVKQGLLFASLLATGSAYYLLSYHTARENFFQVVFLYGFLFALYYVANRYFSLTHFRHLLGAGILFRLLLLFSVPNLSDDVYRFIWDGRLAAGGINPFSHLPAEIMQMPPVTGITKQLFGKLNSPGYFTIYPPVLQGIFWLAAKVFPTNVYAAIVFLKCIIVVTELGNIFLMIQLLKKLHLPKHLSALYFLNPLVITELTGNVHFEGVMIFFVLLAFLLILQNNTHASAISLGAGIATKLFPVLLIPLIINKLGWRKGLIYTAVAGIFTLLLFALLFDLATIQNLVNSVDLFFRKFEFNASIYYLVRWLGTVITGYNIIGYAGPLLSLTATLFILFLSFHNSANPDRALFQKALFIITVWFFLATTVHPWYICLPVALAVFTPYRYAFIWSFTATLSYAAYQYDPVQENLWLVGAGYLAVIGYAIYELKFRRRQEHFS